MSFVTQGVALKPNQSGLLTFVPSHISNPTHEKKQKQEKNKTQYSSVTLVKSLHHCQFLSLR